MDLDNGINAIICAVLNFPTAAMLLVAFAIFVVRSRRPY